MGRADSKGSPQTISYNALSNMLGYGRITQATLTNIIDLHPEIATLIKDYNQDHVELATLQDLTPDEEMPDDTGNGPSVQSMAKSSNPYM
jgi:hypothetical protein